MLRRFLACPDQPARIHAAGNRLPDQPFSRTALQDAETEPNDFLRAAGRRAGCVHTGQRRVTGWRHEQEGGRAGKPSRGRSARDGRTIGRISSICRFPRRFPAAGEPRRESDERGLRAADAACVRGACPGARHRAPGHASLSCVAPALPTACHSPPPLCPAADPGLPREIITITWRRRQVGAVRPPLRTGAAGS